MTDAEYLREFTEWCGHIDAARLHAIATRIEALERDAMRLDFVQEYKQCVRVSRFEGFYVDLPWSDGDDAKRCPLVRDAIDAAIERNRKEGR